MSKVDIIITVYNGENFINDAINSVLQQTFTDYNILVVDDGSTDSTALKVKEFQKIDSRIQLLQPGRVGLAKATNFGLDKSEAEYIAFIDADDLWEKTKLEKQINLLEERKDISLCFTKLVEFETFANAQEKQKFRARTKPMNGVIKLTFLGKIELFEKFGKFNPDINLGDFVHWFGNLINAGCKYEIIPEVLAYRRVHDNNMTKNASRKDFLKILKAHLDAKKDK